MILELFTIWDNCYYEKIGDEVKNIDDEIPFEIPDSWEWVRLGSVFQIGSSKRVHKSDWRDSGIPFYRARDIELLNDNLFKSNLYIDVSFYEELKLKYDIPKKGDLLVSAVGTLGKIFVVENDMPFYYKDGNIICFSNIFQINPYYIKTLFSAKFMINQINTSTKGTTVNTYTIDDANKTLIPLPPINEQNKIIKKINKFDILISQIKKDDKEIVTLIKSVKSKILDDIFGDNSSYKSYYSNRITTNLSKIISKDKIGDGDWVLSDDMDENGEYDLVQLKHIGYGDYIHKPYQSVNNAFVSNNNCSEIHLNYILINRIIAKGLNICILPPLAKKTITSVDVCWIAPDEEKYDQRYLMYLMLSPSFQKSVLLQSSGSTRMRISKSKLIKINFYYHDNIRIQKKIADELQKVFSLLNSVTS